MYCRRYWPRIQHVCNEFWARWKTKFLLHYKHVKNEIAQNKKFQAGDVVLVQNDSMRNKWPMAKVITLILIKKDLYEVCSYNLANQVVKNTQYLKDL